MVPFMLRANFEIILKPAYEQYRENTLRNYDVYLFIKELEKNLTKMILETFQQTRKSTLDLISKSTQSGKGDQ